VSASQGVYVDDVDKKMKKKQSKSEEKAFEKVPEQVRVKHADLTAIVGAGASAWSWPTKYSTECSVLK